MRTVGVLALAFAVPSLAGAAPKRAAPAQQQAPRPTPGVFAGYSYTHAGAADLHGWGLAGTYPVRGAWSLVADLSGHYGSFAGADLGQIAFMGGARWSARPGSRVQPFAEGLLGTVRTSTSIAFAGGSASDSDADWGLALGGGVDYRLAER